jgi:DNA-binding transcriptional ArsR family regulator
LAAIRFHLPEDALEHVCFAYAPLPEAVFSLHVLVEPQHHPLHHSWVREMRELPGPLRRELVACSFALGTTLPDPLAHFPERISTTFEEDLANLRALPEDVVSSAFTPLLARDGGHDSSETHAAMRQARDDPCAFFERLCALLEAYWDAGFAAEWERLEPQLADSVVEAGRLLAARGLDAFVATLEPRVHVLREQQRLVLEKPCPPQWGAAPDMEDIDVDVRGTFTFVPSAFSWPHAWASTEPPWPLGLTYPAPFLLREARPRVPPGDLVRLLRACGDDVRLRVLRRIAEAPRSTQELAPLIGISESALSKHLRQLAAVGLLEPRREGKYVLYHLRRDPLEALSEGLLAYLDADRSVAR